MSAQERKTILLVEDEVLIALAEAQTIKDFGYKVLTATSGEKAVAIATGNEKPDLILMDIDLGKGISGPAAAAEILSKNAIPIVFLTSHSEREMVEKVRGITRYGYVIKNSGDFVLQSSIEMAFELSNANDRLTNELTDRKRAEFEKEVMNKALRESEMKFRMLHERLHVGVLLHDPDTRVILSNPMASTLFGLSEDQMLGRTAGDPIWRFIRENGTPLPKEEYPVNRILSSDESFEYDVLGIVRSGSDQPMWALCHAYTVRDENGLVLQAVVTFVDITERKRAEEALRESERKFSDMVINSPGLVYQFRVLKDGAIDFTYMSPKATDMFGFPNDASAVQWNPARDLHPDDVEAFVTIVGKSIAEVTPHNFEGRFVTSKGIIWFQALARPIMNGDEILFNGLITDITERKQAEEQLRESEESLSTTLRSIGDAVIATDVDGLITRMNPVAEQLTGWSFSDAQNKPITDIFNIVNAKTREPVDNPVALVMERGKKVGLANHTVLISKAGAEHQIADSGAPIKDRNGNIIGVVLVFRDVTEEYKMQDTLREREKDLVRQNSLFSSLFYNLPIGVFMVEAPSGKPLMANEVAVSLLGKSILPDVTKDNLSEVYNSFKAGTHEHYPPEEMPIFLGMTGKTSHIDDMVVERPDGTHSLLEVFGSPVTDGQGQIWASLVSFLDITERKKAEESLRESKEQLQMVADNFPDGIIVLHDFEYRYIYAEGRGLADIGLTQTMLLGKRPRDIFPVEFYEVLERKIEEAFSGTRGTFEINLKEDVFVETVLPIRNKGGRIFAVMGVISNVTERKRAEQALVENRDRMRAIVEGTPHLFFYTQDAEANNTYVSPTIELITGHNPDAWLKRKDWFITDAAINVTAKERMHAHLRGEFIGEPVLVEVRHELGHPILLEVYEYPITKDGRVAGLQGVAHDITERKQIEDQLRRSLEEKQVLLREVHHRVKNNLSVISSLLNLQSSAIQTPEQAAAAFQNSRDRIMAMALVHKELYESRNYARVDMGEYLGNLTQHLLRAYGSGGDISLSAQAEGIVLGVDASIPCGLILNELITNACKHAFPDGRTGEIRVLLRTVDEDSFELSVSDSGIGMPAGYEGRETLGLRLVRLLTEQLGGTMAMSTENGTRCVIRFPRRSP